MEFIDLKAQYLKLKPEIDANIKKVLDCGQYIMGDFVQQLEEELSNYVGAKYCVTCANGTDALSLALMVWGIGPGDAVFVPSFTFYSTAEVVSLIGASPIFIDVDPNTFNMDPVQLEKAILQIKKEGRLKPSVIIPVDLFGLPANYIKIREIANTYHLYVLEDAAQGFGGSIKKALAGSFGDISTTSFFPAKPLGCYGDGGAIFTNEKKHYDLLTSLRVHGKGTFKYDNVRIGMNSRLDTLQAGILLPKLHAFIEYELENRNKVAALYTSMLTNYVKTPSIPSGYISSWAQYTIVLNSETERNLLQMHLKERSVPTMIYYPTPLHQQSVYQNYDFNKEDLKVSEMLSKQVLSLPMHPYLEEIQIKEICSIIIEEIKLIRGVNHVAE